MRVFISYSSQDLAAVQALVMALHERGIECWWDRWAIQAGTDIASAINQGLEQAEAGVIVFSDHSRESRWVDAESSYLTYARIQENKVLIPVMAHRDAWVPPLLRPLARRGIDEADAIADALLRRTAGHPPARKPEHGRVETVLISLARQPDGEQLQVRVRFGNQEYAASLLPSIPKTLIEAQTAFLRGFRAGARSPLVAELAAAEKNLLELGKELCAVCLPQGAGAALSSLVDVCPVGTTVEICFETNDPILLALPFEALRLPDGRLLATLPPVVMMRRPAGVEVKQTERLAGPLKILVAVGAPDEEYTTAAVLDQERELQNILDAVEPAQRLENVDVRILEVGHPETIGEAMLRDAYHVLHISCHGLPGALELEDEDGRAVRTSAESLLAPIRRTARPLPMVFLNSCHGGVQQGQTASFAESLLRAGVPCVVAMQTSVTDSYATRLALAFYQKLAAGESLLPSRALAGARKELERERLAEAAREASQFRSPPEYASASVFVANEVAPIADFGRDKEPLKTRPVRDVAGPVPQLRIDDLIGRRKELRELLRCLRDQNRQFAGVALTGIGGVGKSAVAGRAIQRLIEEGWLVAAHVGRFELTEIAIAAGLALAQAGRGTGRTADLLLQRDLDDKLRFPLLRQVLETEKIVLVLDDFEQNLTPGGSAFPDADVPLCLQGLARSARAGRLLLTCRYPIPGTDAYLRRIPIGPLSIAQTRKLALRLPALRDTYSSQLPRVVRVIGGHPRMLEFLDALLRGGVGRLPHVTQKLQDLMKSLGVPLDAAGDGLDIGRFDEALKTALLVGARDVFLTELLAIAREQEIDEVLLQASCSNLPVTPAGVARMLSGEAGDATAAARALAKLEELSLLAASPGGAGSVHRWTAQGLAASSDGEDHRKRFRRAGRYRMWRLENESHASEDAVEAVRNFLAGQDFDAAAAVAKMCFDFLSRAGQSVQVAALGSEVLETLPESHSAYGVIVQAEANARLALGQTDRARQRWEKLLQRYERLAQAEPDRADYQRDLSVAYNKVGDLYRALGQGEQARQFYLKDLAIAERLAQAEPDRADYQRDLSVSYNKVGDLYRALGQGEQARQSYLQSLAIAERLAQAEPERADYQRDLSVSYERVGDLYRALGQGEQARQSYLQSLAIRERLAQAEPDRADYQRDLSVSYNKVGDLYRALGQGEQARQFYLKDLAIAERLAQAEPERADYQRDLSVSYNKVGDLYRALGQGEQARQSYLQSLAIAERLAQAEPDRADYQRDLSVSYNKVGDLYRALGQGEQARQSYLQSLAIAERLAQAEPERADYQRDLSVSYNQVGDLYRALGQGEQARQSYLQSLAIAERLAQAEPDRADYQRDLSVSYNKVGDLYRDLGQGERARQSYLQSLAIRERLAQAEPDRADYQRDLSVSYNKVGDLYRALGQGEQARQSYLQSLAIRERLAQAEPDRADYQRDLSVSLWRVGSWKNQPLTCSARWPSWSHSSRQAGCSSRMSRS